MPGFFYFHKSLNILSVHFTHMFIFVNQMQTMRNLLTTIGLLLSIVSSAQIALGGLYTPVYLEVDTTEIILRDYLVDAQVQSLECPPGLTNLSEDLDKVILVGNPQEKISFLKVQSSRGLESIVLIKSAAKAVDFLYDRDDIGRNREVRLIGTFNNWNRESEPMDYHKKTYRKTLYLEPGRYQYKLYVDGEEVLDPKVEQQVSNGLGSFNNILEVPGDSLKPAPFSLQREGQRIIVQHGEPAAKLVALWNNKPLEIICKKNFPPTCIIQVPVEAQEIERSFIRIYSYLGANKGKDQLVPLHYGQILNDPNALKRQDWHQARLYFAMVDRFANGNKANDAPVMDSTIMPQANYQGGDLEGINQELEAGYFQRLGTNTVWVSPITENPKDAWGYWDKGSVKSKFSGYHGYWPISNIRIDDRFGNKASFEQLISDAHAQDMNVILDYVANHVHLQHPVYQKNPDWATSLYLPDGTKNTEKWDEYRLTTWFDDHLPTLDLRRWEVVDPMVDSALYWLENYELDGFRHDATKHIDELYWRTLSYRIRKLGKGPVYQIGETYGSPGLINSYISTGMLDAQFDFNLYDAAVATFARSEGLEHLKSTLEAGLSTYGYHHLMGNISGNQDRARFISYASGDVKFDEDPKLAGWEREIPKANKQAYKRLALLHAFNYSVPGIPCIYYGDEIGLPGANDPDNRRMMFFENWDQNESLLFKQVQELNRLRAENLALIYGSTTVTVEGPLLYIRRDYFEQSVLTVFNLSSQKQNIDPKIAKGFTRDLNQVKSGLIEDKMERLGPAPIAPLSYQMFANY